MPEGQPSTSRPPTSAPVVHLTWNLAILVLGFVAASCTSEPWGCGMSASCPAIADVGGMRYAVSGAVDLVEIEDSLSPFAPVSQTNAADAFAELVAYQVEGIDPAVLLIVPNRIGTENPGHYRELWSLADDPFPVALCLHLALSRRAMQPECT